MADAEKELNSLYRLVVTTMLEVHNRSQEPHVLAQLWYVGASIHAPIKECLVYFIAKRLVVKYLP